MEDRRRLGVGELLALATGAAVLTALIVWLAPPGTDFARVSAHAVRPPGLRHLGQRLVRRALRVRDLQRPLLPVGRGVRDRAGWPSPRRRSPWAPSPAL